MILLDTHIWVRWLISDDIGSELVSIIEKSDEVGVSAISCWEVVYLEKHGRIKLPIPSEEWISAGLYDSGIKCIPISQYIAILSANLPDHHRDPADRIIIATAVMLGTQLLSFDRRFHEYSELTGLLLPI